MPVDAASPPTDWRTRPKVLLHEHLDGGLRPQTLLALCRERGLAPPADDAAALAPAFGCLAAASSTCASRTKYSTATRM